MNLTTTRIHYNSAVIERIRVIITRTFATYFDSKSFRDRTKRFTIENKKLMSGGRGAYYKAKYGRGGRGNADERVVSNNDNGLYLSQNRTRNDSTINRTSRDLETILRSIDGRQYGEYKQLQVFWNR